MSRLPDRYDFFRPLPVNPLDLITELGLLSFQTLPDLFSVVVLEDSLIYRQDVATVLLIQRLLISDGLDRGVEVINVRLSINCSGHMLVLLPGDELVVDGLGNPLMDSGVMMAIFHPESNQEFVERWDGMSTHMNSLTAFFAFSWASSDSVETILETGDRVLEVLNQRKKLIVELYCDR